MHTDEQLYDEMLNNIQGKTGRLYRNLMRLTDYKGKDFYSLRTRCSTIDLGYHAMESLEYKQMGMDSTERIDALRLRKFMRFSMTINLNMIQTMNHVIRLTHDQWSRFMRRKNHWMGNFYVDE